MALRLVYSIGKGGVGKTTCAAALAVQSSARWRTLVVSLDPAHNLGDVFEVRLSDTPAELAPNLWAGEIDMEAAISRYLKESSERLKQMYHYLKVINLDGYLDALKLSPGIEEYATLQAMEELIREAEAHYDILVFDTPPTGLTLRVLALPRVSLLWGERLLRLRREILDKRRTLKNIHGERKFVVDDIEHHLPTDEKDDAVMQELNDYISRMSILAALQADAARCCVMPVMNADRLSLFETKRAFTALEGLGMPLGPVIVNKVGLQSTDARSVEQIEAELRRKVRTIPFVPGDLIGREAVATFARHVDFNQWIPGHTA